MKRSTGLAAGAAGTEGGRGGNVGGARRAASGKVREGKSLIQAASIDWIKKNTGTDGTVPHFPADSGRDCGTSPISRRIPGEIGERSVCPRLLSCWTCSLVFYT